MRQSVIILQWSRKVQPNNMAARLAPPSTASKMVCCAAASSKRSIQAAASLGIASLGAAQTWPPGWPRRRRRWALRRHPPP